MFLRANERKKVPLAIQKYLKLEIDKIPICGGAIERAEEALQKLGNPKSPKEEVIKNRFIEKIAQLRER